MITAPEVPRMKNGGIALCHHCQREVYFKGGYLNILIKELHTEAKFEKTKREVARKAARRKFRGA